MISTEDRQIIHVSDIGSKSTVTTQLRWALLNKQNISDDLSIYVL